MYTHIVFQLECIAGRLASGIDVCSPGIDVWFSFVLLAGLIFRGGLPPRLVIM